MKAIGLSLFVILFLIGCTPRLGVGVGVAGVSNIGGSGVAGTEIIADSETGIHGSIVMGTDINL